MFELYCFPGPGELISRIQLRARCQVLIALSSFLAYNPASHLPLSSSLIIIGSCPRWEEEQRTGGFSRAPLIIMERQLAIKLMQGMSWVSLKVWLKPRKHLTLIFPSLPLGEMSQAREYSGRTMEQFLSLQRRPHGHC